MPNIIFIIIVLFITSMSVGIVGNTIGIGGGILLVPFFLFYMHMSPLEASGLSLFTIVASTSGGSIKFIKEKIIDFKLFLMIVLFAVPAAVAGSILSKYVNTDEFKGIFSFIIIIIGIFSLTATRVQTRKSIDSAHNNNSDIDSNNNYNNNSSSNNNSNNNNNNTGSNSNNNNNDNNTNGNINKNNSSSDNNNSNNNNTEEADTLEDVSAHAHNGKVNNAENIETLSGTSNDIDLRLRSMIIYFDHIISNIKRKRIDRAGNTYDYYIKKPIIINLFSMLAGFISGFIGIGIGGITGTFLTAVEQIPPRIAFSTIVLAMIFSSVAGGFIHLAYMKLSFKTFIYLIPLMVGAVIGSQLGAALSKLFKSRALRLYQGWIIIILGFLMFVISYFK